jgi:hypothetical protein
VRSFAKKWPLLLLATASVPDLAAGAQVLFAGGGWAAIERGTGLCEAAALAERRASKGQVQARATIAFDRRRRGQLAFQLGRLPRSTSAVILMIGDRPFMLVARGGWAWSRGPAQEQAILAAIRSSASMRVEGRDMNGRRFSDRYSLAGAPTAIDAAAACRLG